MDNKRQGRNVFVSTFRVPDEYERSRMEAERRAALAEMLEAQAYQPLNVNQPAPIAPSQGLAKVLKQYMGAYEKRKAREAEEKAKGEELETAAEIQGRLMGVDQLFDRDKTGEMQSIYATPEQQQAQIEADIARQRATGQLEEMTPTAQYQRDPMDALRLASTPAGIAATRGNPTLAAMLQKSMEADKEPKSPYGSIDPAKFTAASVKEFDASAKAGSPDYTKLIPREYSELTPQQMYNLLLQTGEFGLKKGQFEFETGQPGPTLSMPNFMVGTQTFGPAAPQAPAPQAPASQAAVAPAIPSAQLSPKQRQELEGDLMKQNLERVDEQLKNASKAAQSLEKTYRTLDVIESGNLTTGFAADLRSNIQRGKDLLSGIPSNRITNDQLLDALLGSEVYGYIQSLGIGARGMDTPAEREFLLSVMAGTREMNQETLREMALMRAKVLEQNIDAINQQINAGDLDWYFNLQAPYGVRKREVTKPTRQMPANADPVFDQANEILRKSGF